jgi:hypothetical protein
MGAWDGDGTEPTTLVLSSEELLEAILDVLGDEPYPMKSHDLFKAVADEVGFLEAFADILVRTTADGLVEVTPWGYVRTEKKE